MSGAKARRRGENRVAKVRERGRRSKTVWVGLIPYRK